MFFYSDINHVTQEVEGLDARFADDLSIFKLFDSKVNNDEIMSNLQHCQKITHKWGEKHRVAFDKDKEEFTILHRKDGIGEPFRLLGPTIDHALLMGLAVEKIIAKCRPKVKAILRATRYYTTIDMVLQFKTHILPIAESATAAIYHASTSILSPVDQILYAFLRHLEISIEDSTLKYNLLPLETRRDIAMLGLLHKCVLGTAHPYLCQLFVCRKQQITKYSTRFNVTLHSKQLNDIVNTQH